MELPASHTHFLPASSLRLAVERRGLRLPCSASESPGQSAPYTVPSVTHELWPPQQSLGLEHVEGKKGGWREGGEERGWGVEGSSAVSAVL